MEAAITALDWQRMLLGDEPPLFLLEIIIRTLIIYLYTLALLRWLGARTISQLSTVEFLLVIALGSAVGDAMFYPEVPLLHAMLVVTAVVLANKLLDLLIARFKVAEQVIDGKPEEVIKDGVFSTSFLSSVSMGTSEVFLELRQRGVEHLGQVARAYIETDGGLTVYLAKEAQPGLPLVPPWEVERPPEFVASQAPPADADLACMKCGTAVAGHSSEKLQHCGHCGHDRFTFAQAKPRFEAGTIRR